MEAKGRTNSFDRNALQRAKEQACQVITISGEAPILHVGLQVHFERGVMWLEVDDPKPKDNKGLHLLISSENFYYGYYRPFRKWLLDGEVALFHNTQYHQRNISEVDINVGLANSIFKVRDSHLLRRTEPEISDDGNTFAAIDGLLVTVGSLWSRKNMLLEPQERN